MKRNGIDGGRIVLTVCRETRPKGVTERLTRKTKTVMRFCVVGLTGKLLPSVRAVTQGLGNVT